MLRALKRWTRLGRWQPLDFNNPSFARIPPNEAIEEETIPDYVASRYYPVRIGEVSQDRYQVVSKLGFGTSSTAWLARDLNCRRYVTLKMHISCAALGKHVDDELEMYRRIAKGPESHPARQAVRSVLDSFHVDGTGEQHRCLVHPPLGDSLSDLLRRNPVRRLPRPILAFVLHRLFLALDYLHRDCHVTHTDIKPDNIMFSIPNDLVFEELEQDELRNPSPRKELNGRTIYLSSELGTPTEWGPSVLCDFGSAVLGSVEHTEDVQPNIYRAPEVILEAPWGYSVDVWNVGCTIWDLFEGESLFSGHGEQEDEYRSRAHLAEMISLLGPPPPTLLARGTATSKFFSKDSEPPFPLKPSRRNTDIPESGKILQYLTNFLLPGNLITTATLSKPRPLELRENVLEGEDRASSLRFVSKMLRWDTSERSHAHELIDDEWIHGKN